MSTRSREHPPVIFINARNGYEVFALDARLLDTLGADGARERLIDALADARARSGANGRSENGNGAAGPRPQRLLVKSIGRIRFVPVERIDWIGAEGNYVCLHVGDTTHLMRETMNGVARQLDPARFVRIHRSAIVNLDRIIELKPACRGAYEVLLESGQSLKLSRSYRPELERRIGDQL